MQEFAEALGWLVIFYLGCVVVVWSAFAFVWWMWLKPGSRNKP
jgi:hypothetical protein